MSNTPAVAAHPAPLTEAGKWLMQHTEKLKSVIPKHLKPERIHRIATNAISRNPQLLVAIRQNPDSLLDALIKITQMGLEADGRRAYLVPFNNSKTGVMEVQGIIGYQGLVELVRNSGIVSNVHADVVYDGDAFEYQYGSGAHLNHKPAFHARGKPLCAYSFCKMKDGSEDFIVMSIEEVDEIRKRSKGGYDKKTESFFGIHAEWPDEMRKKTVFRRHCKWLTLSPEIREQIEVEDEQVDTTVMKNVTPEPARKALFAPPERKKEEAASIDLDMLPKTMADAGISFDQFQAFCSKKSILKPNAELWTTYDDIGAANYEFITQHLKIENGVLTWTDK